jgi:hypothetical protein
MVSWTISERNDLSEWRRDERHWLLRLRRLIIIDQDENTAVLVRMRRQGVILCRLPLSTWDYPKIAYRVFGKNQKLSLCCFTKWAKHFGFYFLFSRPLVLTIWQLKGWRQILEPSIRRISLFWIFLVWFLDALKEKFCLAGFVHLSIFRSKNVSVCFFLEK